MSVRYNNTECFEDYFHPKKIKNKNKTAVFKERPYAVAPPLKRKVNTITQFLGFNPQCRAT